MPIPGDDTGYPLWYIFPLYHTPVPPKNPRPRVTPTPTYRPPPDVEPTRGSIYTPKPSLQRFPDFRTKPLEATNRELRLLLGFDHSRGPMVYDKTTQTFKEAKVIAGLAPSAGFGRVAGAGRAFDDVASSKTIGSIIASIVGIAGALGPGKSEQRSRGGGRKRKSGVQRPAGSERQPASLGSVLGRVFAHTSRNLASVTRAAQRSATAAAAANKASQRPQSPVVSRPSTGATPSTTQPKPFAKPRTVAPNSPEAYKLPNQTPQGQRSTSRTPSGTSSKPASSPPVSSTSSAFTPPTWWQYVQNAVDLLKKPPATPRVKQPKSATPVPGTASLTGDAAVLTGSNTMSVPFASPFAQFERQPTPRTDTSQCECEPKKKRKKSSCTNKVISRVTSGGIRTTKTRITCPSSKAK